MKKNFTIIFILISISLVGIIYIQWNWITTMVENKEEELHHKLVDVTTDVARDLIEYKKTDLSGSPVASFSSGIWIQAFGTIHAGTDETSPDLPEIQLPGNVGKTAKGIYLPGIKGYKI